MFATIVNCIAVILGAAIGLLGAKMIKEGYREVVFNGSGVTTLVIGFSMAFKSANMVYLALALIGGGLIGTWLNIDGAILRFGVFLERLTKSGRTGAASSGGDDRGWDFGHGFLNASVLFCVGAMALVGSFKAGTEGDYTLILTKSVLDGFMAIFFAAALGPGVAFSALPILVYQGALTLAAGTLKPFVSSSMLAELTGVGGALVVMIGLNLLGMKKIKTADFLPALVLMALLVLADPVVAGIAAFLGL
jgi:hypothetical protein